MPAIMEHEGHIAEIDSSQRITRRAPNAPPSRSGSLRFRLLSLLAIGFAVARSASAQTISTPPAASAPAAVATRSTPVTTPADSVIGQMRSRLRNLMTAQERYWMARGTYTTDLAALGFFPPAREDSAFAQVISAGGRGWSGMSTHRALHGKSCVVYVGSAEELPKVPVTRAERRPAEREGEVICDAP